MAAWTIADVDVAIPVRRIKLKAAAERGDLAAIAEHQGWIDILLDIRSYRKRRGLP